jgi:AcrR family transcriptional regulator
MTECCAERGYEETRIEEVIGRAGVSRQSFDDLFSDKEDCALAAIDRVMSETLASVGGVDSAGEADLRQGIVAGKTILELIGSRPSYPQLAIVQARQGGSKRMHERYESGLQILVLLIEKARDFSSQSPASTESAARAALGGVEAVVRRELDAGRAEKLPRLLPDFVYGVLVPLIGQEAALRQSVAASELLVWSEE